MEAKKDRMSLGRLAAIFLILVVLPAGSWYYLSGGMNWRKTAVSELKTFGKIREAWVINPDGTRSDQLAGKVCVVHFFGDNPDLTDTNKKILETQMELAQQFGQNTAFRDVVIWEGGTPTFKEFWRNIPGYAEEPWVYTGGLGGWKTIMINQYEYYCLREKADPVPDYFALSDTTGTIRRFYNALDKKQVERMIQHIAILLPTQKI